ncbi:MAG: hypothetical protein Alis3KO_13040 [Aliiglaciecola sp.]
MNFSDIHGIRDAWLSNSIASAIDESESIDYGADATECSSFIDISSLVTIHAKELRNLIIDCVNSENIGYLYLKGARIKGRLTLEGLGSTINAELVFIQCLFEQGICVAGARLKRLSLRGSRFCISANSQDADLGGNILHINGHSAFIENSLDLSHIRPLTNDSLTLPENLDTTGCQTLTASFCSAFVGGSVTCAFSTFVEERIRASTNQPKIGSSAYALDFSHMKIMKSLDMYPQLVVRGGIKGKEIECHGSVWLIGSDIKNTYFKVEGTPTSIEQNDKKTRVKTASNYALFFQSASFHKPLILSQTRAGSASRVDGHISLLSANIYELDCKHIIFRYGTLMASNMTCRTFWLVTEGDNKYYFGHINESEKKWEGSIYLNNSNIGKATIDLKNAVLDNIECKGAKIEELTLFIAQIKSVSMSKSNFGHLSIGGHITRELELQDAIIERNCEISCDVLNVSLEKADIGRSLDLKKWTTPQISYDSLRAHNAGLDNWPRLNLSSVKIRGSLDVANISKQKPTRTYLYTLECYPNYSLILSEAVLEQKHSSSSIREEAAFVAFLNNSPALEYKIEQKPIFMSGNSADFHRLNQSKEAPLDISTAEKAIQYLVLFCAFVWGNKDSGPFRIVTHSELFSKKQNINLENKERPVLKCELENTSFLQKIVGELHAYSTLSDLYSGLEDDIPFNTPIDPEDLTRKETFLESIIAYFEAQKVHSDNDKNTFDESDYNWFIPATIVFDHVLHIGVFALRGNPDDIGMIDLPIDFPICSISKKSKQENRSVDAEFTDGKEHDAEIPYCTLADFPKFLKRSGGQAAVIKLVDQHAENIVGKLETEDFLVNRLFEKRELKENSPEAKTAFWRAWGRSRKALVELNDASCESLNDNSGRGWGDEVFLRTDRFVFNSLQKRNDANSYQQPTVETNTGFQKLTGIKNFLSEFDVAPDDLGQRIDEGKGINFFNIPDLKFYQQRLLWLCRFHDLDRTDISSTQIDGGTFRRVARIYRKLGLREGARYIDEARIRREYSEVRQTIKRQDWSISPHYILAWISFFAACAYISYSNDFIAWTSLSVIGVVLSFVWNGLSQRIFNFTTRAILKIWDVQFRLCFRYGLSLFRPLATIFSYLLIGWWVTQYLATNDFLVVESTVVAQSVARQNVDRDMPFIQYANGNQAIKSSDVSCGTTIDYGIYALDVFVPLIELDQEERCLIRPFDPHSPRYDRPYSDIFTKAWIIGNSPFCGADGYSLCDISFPVHIVAKHPSTWRTAQAIYVLFGWVIISATLLTFSGYLRKQAEGDE